MSKLLAMAVSSIYVLVAFASFGSETAIRVAIFLIFPLACIIWSDAMGSYKGMISNHSIDKATPGIFVAIAGWILLLIPLIGYIAYNRSK